MDDTTGAPRLTSDMNPGIFHVTFSTPVTRDSGEGLVVIKDGTINGGDKGYFYTGTFIRINHSISSTLRIKQWKPNFSSIFGSRNDFHLTLAGDITPAYDKFSVHGSIMGSPQITIKIDGRRLTDVQ